MNTMEQETCWTLIDDAAEGNDTARETFVDRYLPAVRAYLAARWKGKPYLPYLEDAQNDVFLDCFREGGALSRVDPNNGNGFREFLYGVVRRTAQKLESSKARHWRRESPETFHPDLMAVDELSLSRVFDRTWAKSIIREAGNLHLARAEKQGEEFTRRVELLRLRFGEGMPIREIAKVFGEEPERVHREFVRARREFKDALREVLGLHERCPMDRVEAECDRVLDLLR